MPKKAQAKVQSPGEMLKTIMDKYSLNCNSLSKEICFSQAALRLITLDKGRVTVPVALRLAKYFKTVPEYWLAAQMKYDLSVAAGDKELTGILKGIGEAGKKPAGKKPAAQKKPKAGEKPNLADKRKRAAKVPGAKPAAGTKGDL